VKLAAVLVIVAVALLAACAAYYGRGELPPPWLAFSTCAAVLAVAGLALVHAWRQS
jgi:protein-S-isoprenylcysteine O-methyltransferase Ste14